MESCTICNGQRQIRVPLPERFLPLVQESGSLTSPEIMAYGYPIDCACQWKQPAGKDFGGQFWLHAVHDVSSVLLGIASTQEWFNVLTSCEDGYMSENSDQFATTYGLSTEFAPY